MRTDLNHYIVYDPDQPKDAGTITVIATIFDDHGDFDSPFTTASLPIQDFFGDENDDEESLSIQELRNFLVEADINDDVIDITMMKLFVYVDDLTCSTSSSSISEYFPECALEVQLDLVPDYLEQDDDEEEEEALQASFNEATNNTRFRPACKLEVKSLKRKTYHKEMEKESKVCTICLEELSNGAIYVTLACGHDDFDEECILKWFETSHVCPLCRYELPYEDQMTY